MFRRLASAGALVLVAALSPAARGRPVEGPAVVVNGVGSAHGIGLAMDGVLGQANAGWKYRRILSLFYPGTKPGKASGTIRVGLAEAASHTIELPGGGEVTDAAPGERPGAGFPFKLSPGAAVAVGWDGGTYTVQPSGEVKAAADELVPVPSASPGVPGTQATPVPPSPTPTASPAASSQPAGGRRTSARPIWVRPSGNPALARLAATGRRYRGQMLVRRSEASGGLWAVNVVDLETYVRGIAEEKGQDWPPEALKTLAVAARTLGAATVQWYTRNHPNGFDICPTGLCQLYLGYDGEEPDMTSATNATAGETVAWNGKPILAMYHGNGGGRTESYKLLYGDGMSDPYPYLASVEYPFASPSTWQATFTASQVRAALAARGVAVPGRLTAVRVTERGLSPRARTVALTGSSGEAATTGLVFQSALGLRSAWFEVSVGGVAPATAFDPNATPPPAPGLAFLEPQIVRAQPLTLRTTATAVPAPDDAGPLALAAFALALAVAVVERFAPRPAGEGRRR